MDEYANGCFVVHAFINWLVMRRKQKLTEIDLEGRINANEINYV